MTQLFLIFYLRAQIKCPDICTILMNHTATTCNTSHVHKRSCCYCPAQPETEGHRVSDWAQSHSQGCWQVNRFRPGSISPTVKQRPIIIILLKLMMTWWHLINAYIQSCDEITKHFSNQLTNYILAPRPLKTNWLWIYIR